MSDTAALNQDAVEDMKDIADHVTAVVDDPEESDETVAFVGGKITPEDEDTCYSWQTVTDLDSDLPATDLIDWTVMQEAKERGRTRINLIGANEQRLCGYKAKFNPVVRTHYSLESRSAPTDAIKAVHKRVR